MLKKVRIKNFLSCEDTEIEFDQITILIGRNAAGKSNILKTIEWIAKFVVGNIENYFTKYSRGLEVDFLIQNKLFRYINNYVDNSFIEKVYFINSESELIAERNNQDAYYGNNKAHFYIKERASLIGSMIALLPDKELDENINKIFEYFSELNYYNLDVYDEQIIISYRQYEEWISEGRQKNILNPVTIKILYLWKEDKETFDELKSLLGENSLNLIDDVKIGNIVFGVIDDDFYAARFHIADKELSYNDLSFGTKRVLSILLALLHDKNKILLIEQPEDGIHLGLLRKVLSICLTYAKAYNKQLIITTHSPDVIDMFQAENIRIVRMTEAGTKVNKLDDELLAILPDYLENEGVLSDFIESMDDE